MEISFNEKEVCKILEDHVANMLLQLPESKLKITASGVGYSSLKACVTVSDVAEAEKDV